MIDMGKTLTIDESMKTLKKHRIPVAEYGIAKSLKEALSLAKEMGYPVVLKAISKKALHKTDVGGIVLDIDNEKELKIGYSKIEKRMKKAKAKIESMFVQKMVTDDRQEIIIGGKKDPQFGQTIAFGLGGIFVEVFEDVSFRIVPLTEKDVDSMMKDTKGYKALTGYRGKKYDLKALKKMILKVSRMLEENDDISELDINPVMVMKKGAVAVDARIVKG